MVLYFGSNINGRIYVSFNDLKQAPKFIPRDQLNWSMNFPIETDSNIAGCFNAYRELVEARLEKDREYFGDAIGVFHTRNILTVYEHVLKSDEKRPIRLTSKGLANVVGEPSLF